MENNISRKIESLLTCALCRLPYKEPKTLPCSHSFCKRCLGDYILQQRIKQNDTSTAYFPCPTCCASCPIPQKLSTLPGQEVLKNLVDTMQGSASNQQCTICTMEGKKLAAAFYCTKCEDFLCDDCARIHKRTRMTWDHLMVRVTSMEYAHKVQSGAAKVVAKFGRHGEDLNNPFSLCTNKADDVIVSNDNNDVAVFSATGSCKKHLNQQPFYGDTTRFPHHPNRCVSFTQEGYLAVAIRKKSGGESATCVAVIQSLAGREIGTCVTKVNEFTQCVPSGIAVLMSGNIVVSDAGLNCIYIFDNKFKFVRKFGKKGTGNSKFLTPNYVAVNNYDEILVSDYGNHCVKIFDERGKFKRKIGTMGPGRGQLLHPMGICTDFDGNILIADRDNHRVQVFDALGNYRTVIVKETFEKGKDIRPTDVSFNNSGNLLVLLKGIEGEDFSEIRAFQYDLNEKRHRRSKRSSSARRHGSAPPGGRQERQNPLEYGHTNGQHEFPSLEKHGSSASKKNNDRSGLPPSGRAQKAYVRPLNFEANLENRRPPTAPVNGYGDDTYGGYDSDGYDYHPRRQLPNQKQASKICSIM